MILRKAGLLASAAAVIAPLSAQAQDDRIEIEWWHAMGGELGERVNEIAERFNAHQDRYRVVPNHRGSYDETMTSAISAYRAGEQPHIVQVFEVGTGTMMAAREAIDPVYKLMRDQGLHFNPNDFLSAVVGYYTTPEGEMLSMPFNSSTPVTWINQDILAEAGIDPDVSIETWSDIGEIGRQVVESGAAECGFTTTWQSWIQLENLSAIHDVPFASNANGFEGFEGTELQINSDLHVHHIETLRSWQEQGIFQYGGRQSEPTDLFVNERCAILFESSAGYAGIDAGAEFDWRVSELPYWSDYVAGEPNNSIIGGATLWAFSGHSEEERAGMARFFDFLASTPIQAWWHQQTGYLPITEHAFFYSRGQGFYEDNPGADVPINQMRRGEPTENSRGLRLGNFVQIRDIINEELENVWGGDKSAEEALDDAVERGNEQLRRFERQL